MDSIIVWLIVGAIAGWLAGLIVKGGGFGLLGNIVVGIVGAVVAGWLLPYLGITSGRRHHRRDYPFRHRRRDRSGHHLDGQENLTTGFILETTAALAVVSCLVTRFSFEKKQQGRLSDEIYRHQRLRRHR